MSMLGLGAVVALAAFGRGLVVDPLLERYHRWRDDPNRIKTARRNWRGVYVPDLALKRVKAAIFIAWLLVPLLGYWLISGLDMSTIGKQ